MKRLLLGALLCATLAASAERPKPLLAPDAPAPKDAAPVFAALDVGEVACSFWIRFDKLPSRGNPLGFLGLAAEKDGTLAVTIPAKRSDMLGDYTFRSRGKVKAGQWHHVAFNYSLLMSRASLYVDGHLQFENDTVFFPQPAFGPRLEGDGFAGSVRDLFVYDIALTSDYLLPATVVNAKGFENGIAAARADAQAASAAARNPALKGWANALLARADALQKMGEKATVRDLADLKRDAADAARIARELPAASGSLAQAPVTAYTVDPYGQERLLPYELPVNGRLTGSLDIVAAKGQHEVGSILVVAMAPVKSFTVRATPLACEGRAIPADEVDVKLVKRWFRGGGAWMSYHLDRRQRILTPHLLVNDDAVVKVDELRTRNYLRLDYPEGTIYADVSDPAKGQQSWRYEVPFRDAATLQPIASFTEPGRNQQYSVAVHVPTNAVPGIYTGKLELVCDGKAAGAVDFRLRVLPFELPAQGASYDDLERTYITHMNSLPGPEGFTHEERVASIRESMASIQAHGMNHTSGLWHDPIRTKMAVEAGFVPDYLFMRHAKFDDWRSYYPGVPGDELTPADRELGLRVATRGNWKLTQFFRKTLPGAIPMVLFFSEAGAYQLINVNQAELAAAAHAAGWRVYSHSMGGRKNASFSGDLLELQSDTSVDRAVADMWHAAGGSIMAYAQPFAAPENPALHRRRLGFERYKGAHYDGNMQHGFKLGRVPFNEFAPDPGGDGNYRCVEIAFPQYGGAIYTIAWDGIRAAFDDIRYATLLKRTATECLSSKDEGLRREARRQLIWLEQRDGYNADMRMLRLAMIDRVVTLMELRDKVARETAAAAQ